LALSAETAAPFHVGPALRLSSTEGALHARLLKGKVRAPRQVQDVFDAFVSEQFGPLSESVYADNASLLDQSERVADPKPADYYGPLYVLKLSKRLQLWMLHCSGLRGTTERYALLLYDDTLEKSGTQPLIQTPLAPLYFEKPAYVEDLENSGEKCLAMPSQWKSDSGTGQILRYFKMDKELGLKEVFGYEVDRKEGGSHSEASILKRRPGSITLKLRVRNGQSLHSDKVILRLRDYDPRKLGPLP
jgi:hypothetical protein